MQRPERASPDIFINIAHEQEALIRSIMDIDGIGLFRLEFLYASIGLHPACLSYPERRQSLADTLVAKLALTLAAWYPRPVVVRLSDFKSNEYRRLLGGDQLEPTEENPMLGLRGAARYAYQPLRAAWDLEVQALARLRRVHGLDNLILMIPFVRTASELPPLIQLLHDVPGLMTTPGLSDTPLYAMIEVPSAALCILDILPYVDGVSIGSNDLTQLTLGIDRDNPLVAQIFDETHPAVQELIARVVTTARMHGVRTSICGQAPSDIAGYADWLTALGIDSISYNLDTIDRIYQS